MAKNQFITFKEPRYIIHGLMTALSKEKEKYKKCPVVPDLVQEHVNEQGWGYVVVGYSLVEQAFKALLNFRKKPVRCTHVLSTLFKLLDPDDQSILREYYADYRATIGSRLGDFPFESLDDFLSNLDGGKNEKGKHIGSLDWRYFLVEEHRSNIMPMVSAEYLHEIAHGCIEIARHVNNNSHDPSKCTHSWRMHFERMRKYSDWLDDRLGSDEWDNLNDRVEILWGPDYRGRNDLFISRGVKLGVKFSELPSDSKLPIIDKREEISTLIEN